MPPRAIEIHAPLGGVDRKLSYQNQRPYTTPDAVNVRPQGALQDRERIGSRPGLSLEYAQTLAGKLNLLDQVSRTGATGGRTIWEDHFYGSSLGGWWSALGTLPLVLPDGPIVTYNASVGAVRDAFADLDASESYSVLLWITPYQEQHWGKYQIYFRMDNSSPAPTTAGAVAELVLGPDGEYSGTLKIYSGGSLSNTYNFDSGDSGSAQSGWFFVMVTGNLVTISWLGTEICSETVSAAAGSRLGFGTTCTVAGGACLVDIFRVGYGTGGVNVPWRNEVVAAGGGSFYYDNNGVMTSAGTGLVSDRLLHGEEYLSKYYVANHDDTDTQNLYVYDPADNSWSVWTATAGTLPKGCPLIARYSDRVWLGGFSDEPWQWYACRQADPNDWDYAPTASEFRDSSITDPRRAVSGVSADAGVIGKPLTAMMGFNDDYLIMGATDELWVLVGDPASGGYLSNKSRSVGVLSRGAWCRGPTSEIYFMAYDGLFVMQPGAGAYPQPMSNKKLPRELSGIDPTANTINMQYDRHSRGIYMYITPKAGGGNTRHWWFDLELGGFWSDTYQSAHEPMATHWYSDYVGDNSCLLVGGRDGKIRRYRTTNSTDSGAAINASVLIGPVRLGDGVTDGKLTQLQTAMAETGGSVTISIYAGNTAEAAWRAAAGTARESYTQAAGLGRRRAPRVRGQAAFIKVSGATQWALEHMVAAIAPAGKRRF